MQGRAVAQPTRGIRGRAADPMNPPAALTSHAVAPDADVELRDRATTDEYVASGGEVLLVGGHPGVADRHPGHRSGVCPVCRTVTGQACGRVLRDTGASAPAGASFGAGGVPLVVRLTGIS